MTRKPGSIGRRIIIPGILITFLLNCAGDATSYRTESVSRGDIRAAVTATGTVNAVTTVLVGTQVSGTIKQLFVDFNSPVRKGQLIAQIDPSTFESQVQQARANLHAAQANLDKANAALVDAKRTFERNKELFSRNLVPRSDLDAAETNYESAKALLNSAGALAEQAKAALDISKRNLEYTRIVSPVDGVVISRNVDVGQTVAASFQTPTLFTIARDLTKMQIDTNVAESDIGLVKVDQDVEFTVDAYPDTTFRGTVWQIRQAPIIVQNVVTYDVVVRVDNGDLKLMPGMTANVSIIITTRSGVLRVSNAALRFRMAERTAGTASAPTATANAGSGAPAKKGPAIWILENGKPRRVGIELGITDGASTEISSGDLKEGEAVIVEALKKNKAQTRSGPRMY